MFKVVTGDLLLDDAEVLVNAVNCVGVRGKGIALAFKHKFPQHSAAYMNACSTGRLKLGKVFCVRKEGRWIAHLPSKNHWHDASTYEQVAKGLHALDKWCQRRNIASVAIPAVGAGCGGLNAHTVRKMIEAEFKDSTTEVRFYLPIS